METFCNVITLSLLSTMTWFRKKTWEQSGMCSMGEGKRGCLIALRASKRRVIGRGIDINNISLRVRASKLVLFA